MLKLRIPMVMLVAATALVLSVPDADAQVGGGLGGGGFGGGVGGRTRGNRNTNADSGGDHKTNTEKGPSIPEQISYEQINDRLTQIQEDLKLEPNQIVAWLAFASKVRAFAADVARERSYASASSFQAVGLQYIGQTLDSARNRLTALEDVEFAVKPLYLVLKPEQKSLLDIRIPTVLAPRPVIPGAAGQNATSPDKR